MLARCFRIFVAECSRSQSCFRVARHFAAEKALAGANLRSGRWQCAPPPLNEPTGQGGEDYPAPSCDAAASCRLLSWMCTYSRFIDHKPDRAGVGISAAF